MDSQNENKQRQKKKRRPRKRGKLLKTLFILFITLVILGVFAGVGFSIGVIQAMPNLDGSGLDHYAITTEIYDKNDQFAEKLHGAENRIPVSIDEMSPHLINAVLAIEDQRFYQHHGIDPIRIAGAMWANLKSGRIVQGGSTITQQLVGLTKLDRTEKTLERKIQEAVLAIKVDREYEKDQILEFYLNRSYFGSSAYGAEAAAQTFFGKSASELNIQEAALLAGMIQNPYKHSPIRDIDAAKTRRNIVLNAMVDFGKLTAEQAAELKETPIELSYKNIEKASYNYRSFVDHVVDETIKILELSDEESSQLFTRGYKIYTTLDPKVQKKMEEIYADDSKFPKGNRNELIQSAIVVMDHRTGEIIGMVGGRNQEGKRVFNRATQAIRQPGSAFKPITVFGPALELGYSPATVLDDFPRAYETPGGIWAPKNYDGKYRGLVSMRTAAQYSINVWSVRMLNEIGVDAGYRFAERAGISTLVPNGPANDKGLSIALGGLTKGVTPLEITAAYGAFANKGVYIEPYVIRRIEDQDGKVIWENKVQKRQVMSEETAYLVTSMLETAVEAGTGTRAKLPDRAAAGKTGTTSDDKDIWFIGYTPELVAGVWMGYDEPRKMANIIGGGTWCAPIWKEVMIAAHEGISGSQFTRPNTIVELAVDSKSGLLPSTMTPDEYIKVELFHEDNVPLAESGIWARNRICMDSGQLATFGCRFTETRSLFIRPEPWSVEGLPENFQNVVPLDADQEMPREYCSLHGFPGIFDPFNPENPNNPDNDNENPNKPNNSFNPGNNGQNNNWDTNRDNNKDKNRGNNQGNRNDRERNSRFYIRD
ncbi:MAG: penicillin-binding protein 1A [Peptococcia bacterium]